MILVFTKACFDNKSDTRKQERINKRLAVKREIVMLLSNHCAIKIRFKSFILRMHAKKFCL